MLLNVILISEVGCRCAPIINHNSPAARLLRLNQEEVISLKVQRLNTTCHRFELEKIADAEVVL